MSSRTPLPLLGDRSADALLQNSPVFGDRADVCQALLHDHRDDNGGLVCSLLRVFQFSEHLQTDVVPGICLLQGQIIRHFQMQSLMLSELGKAVLPDYLA